MSQQEKDTRQGQDTTLSGEQEGTTTLQNRRRLLKAAGMAPVIYTLPAGAATAAGSVSCADDGNNILDVDNVEGETVTAGNVSCELGNDNKTCTTDEGVEYVFEENNQGGTITAGSCWTSLNPTG